MQKLSKTEQKLIKSLKYKKYRYKYGLFVVEGLKVIKEFLNSNYELVSLFTTDALFEAYKVEYKLISEKDLKSISSLTTPQVALAVFKIKKTLNDNKSQLSLALDNISDPGNLGTIIRLADWFGITQLQCNEETVDCYNPKVVQATMGSLSRVSVNYTNLYEFLHTTSTAIYTCEMDGASVYDTSLPKEAIIVMGNESHGVSKSISDLSTSKITIPQFGESKGAESLNVAVATSIILSEFKRRTIER